MVLRPVVRQYLPIFFGGSQIHTYVTSLPSALAQDWWSVMTTTRWYIYFCLNNWQRVISAGKLWVIPLFPLEVCGFYFMWLTQILKSWEAHDAISYLYLRGRLAASRNTKMGPMLVKVEHGWKHCGTRFSYLDLSAHHDCIITYLYFKIFSL
jgi:hypothetical protein